MKKILLVEDDVNSITILLSILGNIYDLSVATNTQETHESLREELPDLVILDLFLGEESGIEICKYIKINEKTKNIPVVILTAAMNDKIEIDIHKAGADMMLVKPAKRETLAYAVKTLMEYNNG